MPKKKAVCARSLLSFRVSHSRQTCCLLRSDGVTTGIINLSSNDLNSVVLSEIVFKWFDCKAYAGGCAPGCTPFSVLESQIG
jgi:hypothetical protein